MSSKYFTENGDAVYPHDTQKNGEYLLFIEHRNGTEWGYWIERELDHDHPEENDVVDSESREEWTEEDAIREGKKALNEIAE